MTPGRGADYFANHERRRRFPWSLYHDALNKHIAAVLHEYGPRPRVLVVGCGLQPIVDGGPVRAEYHGCDIDPRAIDRCRETFPLLEGRLAVCPGEYELPSEGPFAERFDVVVAKEVVEHLADPVRFAHALAHKVAPAGELVLTTPNYGRLSALPWLEATVLEWVARLDGYSRKDIHCTRFDRRRLAALDVGAGLGLISARAAFPGWALVGRWKRAARG